MAQRIAQKKTIGSVKRNWRGRKRDVVANVLSENLVSEPAA